MNPNRPAVQGMAQGSLFVDPLPNPTPEIRDFLGNRGPAT